MCHLKSTSFCNCFLPRPQVPRAPHPAKAIDKQTNFAAANTRLSFSFSLSLWNYQTRHIEWAQSVLEGGVCLPLPLRPCLALNVDLNFAEILNVAACLFGNPSTSVIGNFEHVIMISQRATGEGKWGTCDRLPRGGRVLSFALQLLN